MTDHAAARPAAPVVIYVAGSGRSGTTLVERALGAVPGSVNVGETLDLYRQAVVDDERCGCGEPLSRCSLWGPVADEVPVLSDPQLVERMRRTQRELVRQRRMPQLLSGQVAPEVRRRLREYAQGYAAIFAAVARHAGAHRVVDASKWPVQALVLGMGGVDVRVVHVVRDPRGVAYSHNKAGVARPHSEGATMARRPVLSAAARWTATQAQVSLLATRGIPVATLRYDDFLRDPAAALGAVLADLGVPVGPSDLAHLRPGEADLGPSHGVAGNPSRFTTGTVTLRPDEQWREGLPAWQQRAVLALAAPQLHLTARTPKHRPAKSAPRHTKELTMTAPTTTFDGPWPEVAVVLPTRGRPELVRESIRGVVAQDYPGDLDIVVVHDREEVDPTLSELGKPGRRIRVMHNEHTPGLAGARNTGLDHTSAEIVASCDDDDVWHPQKLRLQVARLMTEPDLLVIGSGIRLMMPDDQIKVWPARWETVTWETLLRNRVKELHSSTLVMHRRAFELAGGYDENLPHGYGEDYDWVLRAARHGRIGCITEPLADINKRVQSWYTGRSANTLDALKTFLELHPEIRTSRRGYARYMGQMAFVESTMGQRSQALRDATTAFKSWPATPHVGLAFVHLATGIEPSRFLGLARRFGRGLS